MTIMITIEETEEVVRNFLKDLKKELEEIFKENYDLEIFKLS